jgi:hypothetical protein
MTLSQIVPRQPDDGPKLTHDAARVAGLLADGKMYEVSINGDSTQELDERIGDMLASFNAVLAGRNTGLVALLDSKPVDDCDLGFITRTLTVKAVPNVTNLAELQGAPIPSEAIAKTNALGPTAPTLTWFHANVSKTRVGGGKSGEMDVYLHAADLNDARRILNRVPGWKRRQGPDSLCEMNEADTVELRDAIKLLPRFYASKVITRGFLKREILEEFGPGTRLHPSR